MFGLSDLIIMGVWYQCQLKLPEDVTTAGDVLKLRIFQIH